MSPIRRLLHPCSRAGLLLIAVGANADTLHVPAGYVTLQSAIDAAADGDTVVVADGTYTGPGNRDLDFAGRAIVVQSTGGAANCIIDCQAAGRAFHFHSGETAAARVDGFTVRGGLAPSGSAILCESGSGPTITNCVLTANHATGADDSGGALACLESAPIVVGCVFQANTAAGYGGAVACFDSVAEFTDCRFEDNSALGIGAYDSYVSSPILTRCILRNNRAGAAGAIWKVDGHAVINGCVFEDNQATDDNGGALIDVGDRLTLINCQFRRNSAPYSGGAIVSGLSAGTLLSNCTFSGNAAGSQGGALRLFSSTVSAINCTFSGNEAVIGGAISTGGIYAPTSLPSVTLLSNCIVWGNTAGSGAELALQLGTAPPVPPVLSVAFCDVSGAELGVYVESGTSLEWGLGNLDADPLFVNPASGDFRLGDSSPCIDAGDPAFVPPPGAELDLAGRVRVWDGDGDGSRIVDMGALEIGAPIPGDVDGDCEVGLADLAALLSHFGTSNGATYADGNLDSDGDVELSDLAVLLSNFGATCP